MNASGNKVDFIDFFGNRLSNRLRFVSAGIQGAGHGRTIHMLVEDEYAKYRDPFTLESGILPAMSGSTIRIVIFTAKGMNHAYDLSKTAQDPESNWHYLFLKVTGITYFYRGTSFLSMSLNLEVGIRT